MLFDFGQEESFSISPNHGSTTWNSSNLLHIDTGGPLSGIKPTGFKLPSYHHILPR